MYVFVFVSFMFVCVVFICGFVRFVSLFECFSVGLCVFVCVFCVLEFLCLSVYVRFCWVIAVDRCP